MIPNLNSGLSLAPTIEAKHCHALLAHGCILIVAYAMNKCFARQEFFSPTNLDLPPKSTKMSILLLFSSSSTIHI